MFDTDKSSEKVILVGVDTGEGIFDIESSLAELKDLSKTAGAQVVGSLIQKRDTPDKATYVGKGKIDELKAFIEMTDADAVICDDELSPAQIKNLEKELKVKVMSRTLIILDIFASHAQSAEGKVQVELAQLKYNLNHLTGFGKDLSRQGGGIGTRGPGEKKLETDKRIILDRISELNKELKAIEHHRTVLRQKREKNRIPVIALVGYTNAGKSTLLNKLTDSNVLAEDKLFATLDTTTRELIVSSGAKYLLTDTVGFIQKLPHGLVKAFRATLEESKFADILVHVVDSSNSMRQEQMNTVYKTLKELGVENKPIITVFNKIDKDGIDFPLPLDSMAVKTVMTSAKGMIGLDSLKNEIESVVKSLRKSLKILIPYSEGSVLSIIHGNCEIIKSENTDDGYAFEVFADEETYNRLKKYTV